ncbi:hypothetical protein NXF25_010275 [Crotalus adamanteus]|uniref:Uncharacterized protein n=1 Tax=Crotalus adamanteus TaxID=8729 RepID=A0AAW1BIN6_CROAD
MDYTALALGDGRDINFSQRKVPQHEADPLILVETIDGLLLQSGPIARLPSSSEAYGKPYRAVGVLYASHSAFPNHAGTGMAPSTQLMDYVVRWGHSAGQS